MAKRLTPAKSKIRKACYEYLLEVLSKDIGYPFLCIYADKYFTLNHEDLMNKLLKTLTTADYDCAAVVRYYLPELYKQKPINKADGDAWWNTGSVKPRIAAIKKALKLLKESNPELWES